MIAVPGSTLFVTVHQILDRMNTNIWSRDKLQKYAALSTAKKYTPKAGMEEICTLPDMHSSDRASVQIWFPMYDVYRPLISLLVPVFMAFPMKLREDPA